MFRGPRIGIGIGISTRGGGGVEPEITAYTSGLTTPLSSGQTTLLNTFVKDLKSGLGISALSDAFDVMYILANETEESSLRNLVKRAHDATAVNSPVFTALEGFTGDASSAYIDTNYNPNAQKVTNSVDDSSIGLYARSSGSSIISCGARTTTSVGYTGLCFYNASGAQNARLNQDAAASEVFSPISRTGMKIMTTSSSTNIFGYWNNNKITSTRTSTSLPSLNIYTLAWNDRGTPTLFSEEQQSFLFMGKSFTDAQVEIITDTFEAYMDANGKGVIA